MFVKRWRANDAMSQDRRPGEIRVGSVEDKFYSGHAASEALQDRQKIGK